MDNQIENKTDVRISRKKYSIKIIIFFLVCLGFITVLLDGFDIITLIPFGVISIYLIYFSSKRIAHAVINKLIILPFIFLFSYYILNTLNQTIILATLYLLVYMIILILLSTYLPKKINERKYIFSSEKYRRIADFFDISKPMENILFFKFKNSISRHKYFFTILFIVLVNIFIFIDLIFIARLARSLGYPGYGLATGFILMFIFAQYGPLMLYSFLMLIFNRLTNIFGTNKYNILIFTIIFVLFYFLHYVIPYNDIYMVAAIILVLFIGIIPPKKDKVHE